MLSDLGDRLAKRTFEESGNYVVEPFTLSTEQITGNTSHLAITVGSGVGYNQGHRFETAETLRVPLPKAQESINVASQQVSINFGNYIELDKDQSKNIADVLTSLENLDDVQNIFTNANLKNLQ